MKAIAFTNEQITIAIFVAFALMVVTALGKTTTARDKELFGADMQQDQMAAMMQDHKALHQNQVKLAQTISSLQAENKKLKAAAQSKRL